MRYLSAITMLVLALAIMPPVAAQSFKPDYEAGREAHNQKDYATALKHFRPLAKKGHAKAQGWLGDMYYSGYGVTRDYKQAVKWLRLSANQGDHQSMYNLGKMYRDGEGVLRDLVMASVWLNVAVARQGNASNFRVKQRDKVHVRLTASERRLALKLSKRCLKKPAKCPEYSDD